MINMLILLVLWHFLADFPLQGDFLAKYKSPRVAPPIENEDPWWPWCMTAHCAIQAGGVYLITGWWLLFVLEFILHWMIDMTKCRGHISFAIDQALHLGCKLLWIFLLVLR